MNVIDKMIDLFKKHREDFGVVDHEHLDYFIGKDDKCLKSQCEFEDEFVKLICEAKGHNIGPDQCGKPEHDFCYVCDQLASDLGYRRDEQTKSYVKIQS